MRLRNLSNFTWINEKYNFGESELILKWNYIYWSRLHKESDFKKQEEQFKRFGFQYKSNRILRVKAYILNDVK